MGKILSLLSLQSLKYILPLALALVSTLIGGLYLQNLRLKAENLKLQNKALVESVQASVEIIQMREKQLEVLKAHAKRMRELAEQKEEELMRLENVFATMKGGKELASEEEMENARVYLNTLFSAFMRQDSGESAGRKTRTSDMRKADTPTTGASEKTASVLR